MSYENHNSNPSTATPPFNPPKTRPPPTIISCATSFSSIASSGPGTVCAIAANVSIPRGIVGMLG